MNLGLEINGAGGGNEALKKRRPDFRPAPGENKFLIHFGNHLLSSGAADIRLTTHTEHCALPLNNDTIVVEAWEPACHHYWGQLLNRRFQDGFKAYYYACVFFWLRQGSGKAPASLAEKGGRRIAAFPLNRLGV